jgi:hypothetical protein
MPHKENTILTEQIEGLLRMARGYMGMTGDNIGTWEERAIEQSCVERVAWPDLYHVTIRAVRVITKVLEGLRVYPDNMMKEVMESCGCYAASEAKEFLKKRMVERGFDADEGYRIVQLAAFNCFVPLPGWMAMRNELPVDLEVANSLLNRAENMRTDTRNGSIQIRITRGMLEISSELEACDDQVTRWNAILSEIFSDENTKKEWDEIFKPSYLLRNEPVLYERILGE